MFGAKEEQTNPCEEDFYAEHMRWS